MSVPDEPVVLIAVAESERAAHYADWLDDRFDPHVVGTAQEAMESLEAEPALLLLDRRLPDRPGDDVLGAVRAADLTTRVAMLTSRDVELDHLDVETVAPYPEDEDAFADVMESLRAEPGLERAVRSYRRLAERRAALAEELEEQAADSRTDYQTLSAKLTAQRDRIVDRLDRLAAIDEPRTDTGSGEGDGPDAQPADPRDQPFTVVEKFRQSEHGPWFWVRAGLVPFLIVLILFGLLVAITGTMPPLVGVASDSMAPQIQPGDLIVVTAPGRYAPDFADREIVSYREARAEDYRSLNGYGSVIVFQPPDADGPPTIHRVMFVVEAGENWFDRANGTLIERSSCTSIEYCPAPHDGYITKGDNNMRYDQSSGLAPPVKREWILGVAKYRIPLGEIRKLVVWMVSSVLVRPI